MCGFAGVFGLAHASGRTERLAAAVRLLRHRGPDDEGFARGPGYELGFRRLSILDLSAAGHQPMTTREEDAVLVFNGEIYNFRALRAELERTGVELRSSGDSEVLLQLLRAKSAGALPGLNGMFAFAFLDLRTRKFLLARDRLGVKPLYWLQDDSGLLFASELPALLALHGRKPSIDRLALNRYLAFAHVPPPLTIWEGIHKLPPGHLLAGALGASTPVRAEAWWQLDAVPDGSLAGEEDWLDEVDALLADATRLRLESDVPVGLFLSGGIDSGLVSHHAARQAGRRRVFALTVAFDEREYSELEVARAVARSAGLEHEVVRVTGANLDRLPEIVWHAGEPFADSSVVNQDALARAARAHGKVFLTGDGGDEAFAGYDEYVRMARWGPVVAGAAVVGAAAARAAASFLRPDSLLQRRLWKLSGGAGGFGALVRVNFRDPLWRHAVAPDWQVPAEAVERQAWAVWEQTRGLPLVTRMQRFDYQQYLEGDVLVKVDRATMAHSVESRSPFLDHRLVELAARIPVGRHIDGTRGKRLLRALARRHLPAEVWAMPKRGFGLPVDRWFREGLAARISGILLSERARARGFWRPSGLRDLVDWEAGDHGKGLHALLWRFLMLELWARVFLDEDPSPWAEAAA